jgi:hypothetical protein
MSTVLELFVGSFLLCPAFTLRVSDSLSGGGTQLALLRGRRGRRFVGSVTGQQSTGVSVEQFRRQSRRESYLSS